MATNILTTQSTDDDILKTDAGNPYPVHLVPASRSSVWSSRVGRTSRRPSPWSPAPHHETISDAAYTSGAAAVAERVSISMAGQLDAQATVTAQLLRDGVAFGAIVSWFSDAAGNFGGTIDELSPTEGPVRTRTPSR